MIPIFKGALLGGLLSGILNLLLGLGAGAAGAPLEGALAGPGTPIVGIPAPMFLVASVIPAVGAALLYAGLRRLTEKSDTIFVVISVVFGLLSMAGPAMLEGATVPTKAILGLMHVVAGVGIVLGIFRTTRP
jgi:Family of unknown function (DUF6069)